MKYITLILICFLFCTSFADAYTAYYYFGQYFKITSSNTAELIKPIKSDNMTMKQEYKGDFVVQDVITIDFDTYLVTKIADSAFNESTITSLTLGEYVDSIGDSACANCKSITAFYSNEKLSYIGNNAFAGCYNLSKVLFPQTLTYIGDNAFSNCFITEELSIPSRVVSIGDFAFFGARIHTLHLNSVELSIGDYAFGQIPNFETVNITSLINWCNYKFYSEFSNPLYFARNLTLNGEPIVDLDLSNEQITTIPIDAFIRQNNIKTIKLGSNIETISSKAFYTSSIDSIFITAKIPPQIKEDSFIYSTYRNAILTVPVGCAQRYREDPYWSSFNNIIEEPEISGISNMEIKEEDISINGQDISVSKPTLLEIFSIDGKCLFNGISSGYSFPSPGVYIVNGTKYSIQ